MNIENLKKVGTINAKQATTAPVTINVDGSAVEPLTPADIIIPNINTDSFGYGDRSSFIAGNHHVGDYLEQKMTTMVGTVALDLYRNAEVSVDEESGQVTATLHFGRFNEPEPAKVVLALAVHVLRATDPLNHSVIFHQVAKSMLADINIHLRDRAETESLKNSTLVVECSRAMGEDQEITYSLEFVNELENPHKEHCVGSLSEFQFFLENMYKDEHLSQHKTNNIISSMGRLFDIAVRKVYVYKDHAGLNIASGVSSLKEKKSILTIAAACCVRAIEKDGAVYSFSTVLAFQNFCASLNDLQETSSEVSVAMLWINDGIKQPVPVFVMVE